MKYKEIKEICLKLDKKNCYFRHPQKDFVEILGQDTVDKLVAMGWLKYSAPIQNVFDYKEPCYEYGKLFRKIYNFIVNPTWMWFKIYVLQLWRVKCWWQNIRIACGHHYDWQYYSDVYSLDEI